jgi:hypothetical protein
MSLYIRMGLYLVFGVLAGQGLVLFDADTGTVSFKIDDLLVIGTALVGYFGTFLSSRVAKAKGGMT